MSSFVNKYNVKLPIKLLFTRSNDNKKINFNKYNMSGSVPKIQIETENSSRPIVQIRNPINVKGIDVIRDSDDSASDASGSTVEPVPDVRQKKASLKSMKSKSKFDAEDYQSFVNNSKKKAGSDKDSDSGSESDSGSDNSDDSGSGYSDYSDSSEGSEGKQKKDPKQEKQQILLKLLALEKKGVELTKKYSMSSKLSDLRFELEIHQSNTETEMSVKFQQKMLMAAVTGLEFANKKFDPIGAKLEGWSESVMDNMDDYESVFERLHEKYKTRAELPPELQLMVTLAGSAIMFHVTKSLFSGALSGGGNGLQNSEIMKNIASAMSNPGPPPKPNSNEISGPSMNLANMMRDDDTISNSTVETSKEVKISDKGKRAINI
jgi:hypothetical protein|tara:strand:+ start:7620 stop:8750 length:1131 start_codon:yes stop_codon:yes gene_type:complete